MDTARKDLSSQFPRVRSPLSLMRRPFDVLRLLKRENPLERLGRFWWVRGLYSQWQSLQQSLFPAAPCHRPQPNAPTSFAQLGADFVDNAIAQLGQHAIASGLTLPPSTTAAIANYARSSLCFEPGREQPFYIDEVSSSQLDGDRILRGLVAEPDRCLEIAHLRRDPLLLKIVHRYLRYWPTKITTHLTWSVANPLPLQETQKIYPPTRFHYDIAGVNFMTVYFYITSVRDRNDGAHMMIPGTHKRKPLSLMLSGSHANHVIDHHFGLQRVISILGESGSGFIQDPSCIHRLHPPVEQHRLLLQFRYS